MKDLTWGSALSVQVDEIDEDHRRLVELFNLLNHAVVEGEAPNYPGDFMNLCRDYAVHWFHKEIFEGVAYR